MRNMSEKVMGLTDENSAVNLRLSPDIEELSEKELLYYIAEALSDAADALATY